MWRGGCSPWILLNSGPPVSFTQTQIPREAALGLGPEGGVLESPSSTLASRGAHNTAPPSCAPGPAPHPHFHNVTPSFLPVRKHPVVSISMTSECAAKSVILLGVFL